MPVAPPANHRNMGALPHDQCEQEETKADDGKAGGQQCAPEKRCAR